MEEQATATRACPLCREEIRADAVRCKHCHGTVDPQFTGHGGICPFCKESIHPEAIRCKHCKADLTRADSEGCCKGCAGSLGRSRFRSVRQFDRALPELAGRTAVAASDTVYGPHKGWGSCSTCPAWVQEGTWFGILIGCNELTCRYVEY